MCNGFARVLSARDTSVSYSIPLFPSSPCSIPSQFRAALARLPLALTMRRRPPTPTPTCNKKQFYVLWITTCNLNMAVYVCVRARRFHDTRRPELSHAIHDHGCHQHCPAAAEDKSFIHMANFNHCQHDPHVEWHTKKREHSHTRQVWHKPRTQRADQWPIHADTKLIQNKGEYSRRIAVTERQHKQ